MTTYCIARLSAAHVAPLADLDGETNPHPWTGKQWLDSLSHHDCFGLWQGEQLLGFAVAMATLDEAEILLIAIHPERQGQGLGRQLLLAVERELANEGVRQLFLEVRDSNQSARGFYQSLGWQESGRRKNYYPCLPSSSDSQSSLREDAILCSKALTIPSALPQDVQELA
ncbi:ribosomal protein S18-alanine N-acetyltransferase [Chitinibacter tainanensis]|uniref:ribosomal protein S18-alanine N-acetyltransferase n=1 Tax=Chitinibacter tainanensis TaxID=230667 RepID=UPI000417BF6C|nr:ribosomal protein S18-alanine N-acetyltransferase [Chitinibacter tainanensis]